jgi:uncharacterized protein (DUF2126 family)
MLDKPPSYSEQYSPPHSINLYSISCRAHTETVENARQIVKQSKKSRGMFDTIFKRKKATFLPTYNFVPDGNACRVYGTLNVKKATGEWASNGLSTPPDLFA